MKPKNGYWMWKEGVASFGARCIYETESAEKEYLLAAGSVPLTERGRTLGGVFLTLRISAPAPGVFRIRVSHYEGIDPKGPCFELSLDPQVLNAQESEESVVFRNGELGLTIRKDDASLVFTHGKKFLTASRTGELAYLKTGYTGPAYTYGPENAFMSENLTLSVDELIYGFGERFGPLVKNGQSIAVWNEDGGTNTEQSYKNVPFYWSNRGYGVFVNHPERVEFEVGSHQVSKVSFSVPGEYLDYFFIDGPDPKDVLQRYTALTGRPALPPLFSFGLWLSTSFTTDYDEQTVMHFIDGMFERGIPISVFHFDCFWMKGAHWTDFLWDEKTFPDPEGMLKRIHEKGVKVCVWINPYIAQRSRLFAEGKERGYLAKRPDGSVWQWDMWQPGMAVVDFTNPEACRWFKDGLKSLLAMGVDCFKTDFGERIPTEVAWYDGSDPEKMHNYYSYLYNKTVFEALEEEKAARESRGEKGNAPCLFARSATAGGQKFPVHWGGDCFSDYPSMEQSLRGGLSLTNSGFGFWSHDIGGFEAKSSPDVYKRWCAFGLLSTHSRLHGSSSYRVPWNYDEEAVEVLRTYTALKLSLLPYFYSGAVQTHTTGIPLLRSMAMEFPGDENARYLDKQYMLGDALLVSPVFNEEGTAHFYLPEGHWNDMTSGEALCGPVWKTEERDYLAQPVFVRENSLLFAAPGLASVNESYRERLVLTAYEPKAGASAEVYDEAGLIAKAMTEETEEGLVLRVQGDPAALACMQAAAVRGGAWTMLKTKAEGGTLTALLEEKPAGQA